MLMQGTRVRWRLPMPTKGTQYCVNSAWLLDDFRDDNGPTRLIPGSHRGAAPLAGHDGQADHPDQRLILAPAGSVLIFSGSDWHGGTVSRSRVPRRVVHSSIIRRDHDLGPPVLWSDRGVPAPVAINSRAQVFRCWPGLAGE